MIRRRTSLCTLHKIFGGGAMVRSRGRADPVDMRKIILVSLAIVAVSLGFIASYSAALHAPSPHEVPLAVSRDVPTKVAAELDRSPALAVTRSDDPLRAIDRREAYGALTVADGRLRLTTAPAA